MHPVVALVGRTNVGKSTLFNRLTGSRSALVADVPGLTRDRLYGEARAGDRAFTLIDTGGLTTDDDAIATLVAKQVQLAIDEADLVLFVIDARAGIAPGDHEIADKLRRAQVRTCLVANKVDEPASMVAAGAIGECTVLGLGEPVLVSAEHGLGLDELDHAIGALLPVEQQPEEPATESTPNETTPNETTPNETAAGRIRIAVVGRPNVGKSTLINRWLGEERQLVYDEPGTTRDSVMIPFDRGEDRFTLIDTAGVRRRGRRADMIEKFSVMKSLEAIRRSDVVVLLINAQEDLVDQDLHLLGYAVEMGTGVVLGVNKWDGLAAEQRDTVKVTLERRLDFAPWIPLKKLSALKGTGVWSVLEEVVRIARARRFDASTTFLNRVLNDAVIAHQPPTANGRRIKLRFVHKAGASPPRVVIHGNQTKAVPASYTRFLEKRFRDALDLTGTPFVIEYATGDNPFADRANEPTNRQRERRQRIIRHRKSRER